MIGNQKILVKLKRYRLAACPPATQDVALNLENRQTAIDTAMYGPLDVKNPGDYWEKIADEWGVPV